MMDEILLAIAGLNPRIVEQQANDHALFFTPSSAVEGAVDLVICPCENGRKSGEPLDVTLTPETVENLRKLLLLVEGEQI